MTNILDYLRGPSSLEKELTRKITHVQQRITLLQSYPEDGQGTQGKIVGIVNEFHDVNARFNHVVGIRIGYSKQLFKAVTDLREIRQDLSRIEARISDLEGEYRSAGEDTSLPKSQTLRSVDLPKTFVERPAEMDQLIRLIKSKDKIIAICGTCGLGKTIISRKLYEKAKEMELFQAFAWVDVSDTTLELSEILQSIYKQLLGEDVVEGSNQEMIGTDLAKEIYRIQKEKGCLIVLDDLWSSDVLLSLHSVFPAVESGSKIWITTRLRDAAENAGAKIHNFSCLTVDEGRSLILKIADAEDGDLSTEDSEEIVKWCEGLPLAITEFVDEALKYPRTEWNHELFVKIAQKIGGTPSVLEQSALSFNNLPHFLRQCIPYLGILENNSQVEVEKLYMLLLADGNILHQDRERKETLMKVAERYLNDLAEKSVVEVQQAEVPTIARFGSCKLNPLMRQLCSVKSKELGFFEVSDFEGAIQQDSSSGKELHKLHGVSINLNSWKKSFWQRVKEQSKRIGLMLLSMKHGGDLSWPKELRSLSRFENLKALTFTGFSFGVIPEGIEMPIKLRYLSFNGSCLARLSSSVQKLKFLEILDMRVLGKMVIPNVLRSLRKLKHLYFPLSFEVEGADKLRLDGLENLETITNMNTKLVDVEDLFGLSNLCYIDVVIPESLEQTKRIAELITTNISVHILQASVKIREFDCYTKENCSILKQILGCPSLIVLDVSGYISELPWSQGIDSNLAKIVLVDSQLVEGSMETLEKFPKLRVLVLEGRAYMGKDMMFSTSGFKELRRLELLNLVDLEKLEMGDGAMPKLSKLTIRNCTKTMIMPPTILGELPKLQELVLEGGAYMGTEMKFPKSGFKELRKLELLNLEDLEEWEMEDGAMPRLSNLAIRNCKKLIMDSKTLEKLPELQELVLEGGGYLGKEMNFPTSAFKKLRKLELLNLEDLEEWEMEDGAMPRLSNLAIRNCKKLIIHPKTLETLPKLQELVLEGHAYMGEEMMFLTCGFKKQEQSNLENRRTMEGGVMPMLSNPAAFEHCIELTMHPLTLEIHPELQELVLDGKAIIGKKLTFSSSGFKELRTLELLDWEDLVRWIVEEGTMPKLSNLAIKHCKKLIMHPKELGFIRGLQDVKVSGIHDEFMQSLKSVGGNIKFEYVKASTSITGVTTESSDEE